MKKEEWNQYIGCLGLFDEKGMFNILPTVHVVKIHASVFGNYMVVGQKGVKLLITNDGLFVGSVLKKFVKIVE